MATLKQIAAEAGVSVMTVSNVIHNNRSKVSPATVEKVQQLIEKYHYVPNMAARSLIAKESHIIAVLLPLWNKIPLYFINGLPMITTAKRKFFFPFARI